MQLQCSVSRVKKDQSLPAPGLGYLKTELPKTSETERQAASSLDTRMLDSGHSLFYLSLIQIHFIARNAKLSHRGSGMANAGQVSISEPFVPKE